MSGVRTSQKIWIAGAVSAFVLVNILASGLQAAPRPDEERYYDREDMQNVATWLAMLPQADTQFVRASLGSPCNPGAGNNGASYGAAPMMPLNKRNSELINSLLSLPKTLNNAGK